MKFKIFILLLVSYLTVNPYVITYLLGYFNLINKFIETFNNNFNMFISFFVVVTLNLILFFFSKKRKLINFIFLHVGYCLLVLCCVCFLLEKGSLNFIESYSLYSLKIDYLYASLVSFIFLIAIDFTFKKSNEIIKFLLFLCLILLDIGLPIDSLIKNLFIVSVSFIMSSSYKSNKYKLYRSNLVDENLNK